MIKAKKGPLRYFNLFALKTIFMRNLLMYTHIYLNKKFLLYKRKKCIYIYIQNNAVLW